MAAVNKFLNSITVEPVLLLFSFAGGLKYPTDNALWYRKICLSLYTDDEWICDNLKNDSLSAEEEAVQVTNSEWNFYKAICLIVPQFFVTALYGSWSDTVSRKLPILIPVVGAILSQIIYMAGALVMESALGFLLLGELVSGLSGFTPTILMAAVSYIADVTSFDSRTFRISITYACIGVGNFTASILSGIILENTGYVFVYGICMVTSVANLLFIIFGFDDIKRGQKGKEDRSVNDEQKPDSSIDDQQQSIKEKSAFDDGDYDAVENHHGNSQCQCADCCGRYCQISHFKSIITVTFKKRSQNHRMHVLMLIVAFMFTILCNRK